MYLDPYGVAESLKVLNLGKLKAIESLLILVFCVQECLNHCLMQLSRFIEHDTNKKLEIEKL